MQSLSPFFRDKKNRFYSLDLNFYALIIGFFRSVQADFRMVTPWLLSMLNWFLPIVSCKFCYEETFCVLIYGETVYIQLYRCTSCKYNFTFYDLGINLQIFQYFRIFVDPSCKMSYKGKQNEKIQRVKVRLSLKANYIRLTISSNLKFYKVT